jgi:outer membrane protein
MRCSEMCRSVLLGALVLAGFSQSVEAEARVSVVDVQRVITTSKAGQRARQEVEAEVKKGESRIASLKSEFEALEKAIQKQADVLSGTALEEKQGELRKKERALRVALEDQRDVITRKNRAEIGKVVNKIDAIIKEMGASGRYGVIIDSDPRLVLFYDKKLDISDEVISRLDGR